MSTTPDADWLHLAPTAESDSLLALHDARLVAVRSDRVARTAVLTVDHEGMRAWMKAAPTLRFVLSFDRVQSVRASAFTRPPGAVPQFPAGTPMQEQSPIVAEYQSRWREESVSWSAFEQSFASDDDWLDILDGEWAGDGRVVTVHLGGNHRRDDQWHDIWIRAERFCVSRSDGEPFDLDALWALSDAYWDQDRPRG